MASNSHYYCHRDIFKGIWLVHCVIVASFRQKSVPWLTALGFASKLDTGLTPIMTRLVIFIPLAIRCAAE